MNGITLGDGLQFYRLRSDGHALKTDLQRLTTELSSGKAADIGEAVGGNFRLLSDINRQLRLSESFAESIAQAATDANMRQLALEKVEGEVSGFAANILAFSATGSFSDLMLTIGNASDRLDEAVTALNTKVAGKSLFAGNAPDQSALISGSEMLDALRPLVAGASDAASMRTIVEDWFMAPGGGYETVAWQGGPDAASPLVLSEGVETDTAVSALDPAVREVLSGLALAALAAEGAGPPAEADRRALAEAAAARMQSGEGRLIVLRSDLGATQARIEIARVEVESTRTSLRMERSRLTEVDPYRTASELQSVQTRLESIYLLTSRLSQLSLTEYLR
jgi:flagellar hook-associated protein 3 FlgL